MIVTGRPGEDVPRLAEALGRPCCVCGDVTTPTRVVIELDDERWTFCARCCWEEVPESVASHPKHFVGASLVTDRAANQLVFNLDLRRYHVAGRVPMPFRRLFAPEHWPSG